MADIADYGDDPFGVNEPYAPPGDHVPECPNCQTNENVVGDYSEVGWPGENEQVRMHWHCLICEWGTRFDG